MLLRILLVLAFLCDLSVESIACDKRCLDDLQRQIDRMNKSGADAQKADSRSLPPSGDHHPARRRGLQVVPQFQAVFPDRSNLPGRVENDLSLTAAPPK